MRSQQLQRQIQRFTQREQRLHQLSLRFTWIRLGIAGVTLLLATLFFVQQQAALGWSIVGLGTLIFIPVVRQHRLVKRGLLKQILWLKYKKNQLARVQIDWDGLPPQPPAAHEPQHPFELDFDLTGPYSLHCLLDTCISEEGSNLLQSWLLQREPVAEAIAQRQQGIKELMPRGYFREQLWLQSELTKQEMHQPSQRRWQSSVILRWFNHVANEPYLPKVVGVLSGLAGLNLLLLGLHTSGWLTLAWWKLSWAVYGLVFFLQRHYIVGLFNQALSLDTELSKMRTVLAYLENSQFKPDSVLAIQLNALQQQTNRPSHQISVLGRILAAASLQNNLMLWFPLNALVPWDFFWSWHLLRRRQQLKEIVPLWLKTIWQIEALGALANWAWLNPGHVFPEWSTGTVMYCQQVGHPLIPPTQRINNDFHLKHWGEVHLITGSNMAGKSTFLRTLGLNLVLAYAGAPILAQRAQLPLTRLFACLRVSDSVTDGLSYFYAEVKRLKALLDALNTPHSLPLFFFIDEIFRGTNNRERLLGSQAFLQALIGQHGAGLVSTHDLELVKLADSEPRIQNFHFRETIASGKMCFDYRLQLGPCPTTNALRIMALEGLPIPPLMP